MQIWVLLVIVIAIVFVYYSDFERWMKITRPMVSFARKTIKLVPYFSQSDVGASDTGADIEIDDGSEEVDANAGTGDAPSGDKRENLARKLIIEGVQNADSAAAATDIGPDAIEDEATRARADPGFVQWVDSIGVDSATRESHRQYVEERTGNEQTNALGTTRPLDRHDTYEAVPWRGLSRPARVAVDSPMQLADIDYERFPEQSRVRWTVDYE